MREKSVIFFDGVCNVCHWAVLFVLRHEKRPFFYFQSLQESKYYSPDAPLSSLVMEHHGEVLTKSAAVLTIARHLKFPYSMISVFRVLPSKWTDYLYDVIAQNRFRWFGKKEQCMVPDTNNSSRFL